MPTPQKSSVLRAFLSSIVAGAVLLRVLAGWAGPDPTPDPLADLRARTAALSEDLLAQSPEPGHAAMLGERLARRVLREQSDRIADLFAKADAGLATDPALRVETALLGARLLSFDEQLAPAATARLRAALSAENIPAPTRAHGRFGLAFLLPEIEDQLEELLAVVESHPDSPYAPLAAAEAIGRACDLGRYRLAAQIERGSASASPADRREIASRLARGFYEAGGADFHHDLPGKPKQRFDRAADPGAAFGLLIRLSPPRAIEPDRAEDVQPGELDAPEIVARWSGDVPAALLEGRPAGRWLAFRVEGRDVDGHLYELATTVLQARVAPEQVVLFAGDARTGAPKAGARLRGELVQEGQPEQRTPIDLTVGADGIARIPIDPPIGGGASLRLSVAAEHADGCSSLETSLYPDTGTSDGLRVALFAAKPVVRPGEAIDFRVVARDRTPGRPYSLPAGTRLAVSLQDENGGVFFSDVVTLSDLGTVTLRAPVPEDAALGMVRAHVESQDGERRVFDPEWGSWEAEAGAFSQALCRIEEYRLADVIVHVEPEQPCFTSPGIATIRIRAEAPEGGPVAGFRGALELRAYRDSWWSEPDPLASLPFLTPPVGDRESDETGDSVDLSVPDALVSFTTDAEGFAPVRLPLSADVGDGVVRVYLTASGADGRGREGKGFAALRLTRDPARIAIRLEDTWGAQRIRGRVSLVDALDRPIPAPVTVIVRDWDGRERARRELDAGAGDLDVAGLPGGTYFVEGTATVDGRAIHAREWAWLWGGGGTLRAEGISLRADGPVYRPGDTMTVHAILPDGAQAVFASLESDRIFAVKTVAAVAGAADVSFPVTADLAPNVRVVVSTWANGTHHESSLERFVDAGSTTLSVEVAAAPETAKPGEEAAWTVRVHDAQGAPVDAEVSLAVVDERVFAVQEDPAPLLLRRFAPLPRRHRVVGARTAFAFEMSEESTGSVSAAFASPEESDSGGLPDVPVRIRRDFRDLVGWFDAVRTGADGEVTVKAPFSDSLTRWRATARAFSTGGGTGEGRGQARTHLPVTLRLDVPRVVRRGDRIEVTALVRNHTDRELSGTLELVVTGLSAAGEPSRKVTIPAGGEFAGTWTLAADTTADEAKLRGLVRLGEVADGVEKTFPIESAGTRVAFSVALRPDAGGQASASFAAPHDPERARLEVTAAPEDLQRLLEPLDALLHYPYGCVEQTMSGFMPAVVVQAALDGLGVRPPGLSDKVAAVTQAGIGRLIGFQHDDGGWGWWTGDSSDAFMTTYVVHGLGLAQRHGVAFDAAVLERGAQCLAGMLPAAADAETHWFARWALVSAGKAPASDAKAPSPDGSAVALAYAARVARANGNAEEAARLRANLAALVRTAEEGAAFWEGQGRLFHHPAVATAIALECLMEAGDRPELVRAGIAWLDRNRRAEGYGSTISNAFAALACARGLRAETGAFAGVDARVAVNGRAVAPVASAAGDPVRRWSIPMAQATALAFAAPAGAKLRLSAIGVDWVSDRDLPRDAEGFLLVRRLHRLNPGGDPDRYEDWAAVPSDEPVIVGERYQVVYVVVAGPHREYLAVVDPRPAGLEPGCASGPVVDAYLEVHDREVAVFLREVQGGWSMRMPVRFDTPGTVTWPAARAFLMYDESVQAFAPSQTLRIVRAGAAPKAEPGRVAELAQRVRRWKSADSAPEEETHLWLELPLDLSDADRREMQRLALECRHSEGVWSGTRDTIALALWRSSRAHDAQDVECLLALLDGVDPDRWPGVLADARSWIAFEAEIARAAVGRGSKPAWAVLCVLGRTMRDSRIVVAELERAGQERRAARLDDYAGYFGSLFSVEEARYGGMFVSYGEGGPWSDEAESGARHAAWLAEWLAALAGGNRQPDLRVLDVYCWAALHRWAQPEDAGWRELCALAVKAAEKMPVADADWSRLGLIDAGLDLRTMLAGRAIREGSMELWTAATQVGSEGRSPAPLIDALAATPPEYRAGALETFLWPSLGGIATANGWGLPPAEWREMTHRLVPLVDDWRKGREWRKPAAPATPGGEWFDALFWIDEAIERAGRLGVASDPSWEKLRDALRAKVEPLDPAAPETLAAISAAQAPLIGRAWIRAWLAPKLAGLARSAPALALRMLAVGENLPVGPALFARVAALEPEGRAAVFRAGADEGSGGQALEWLQAFAGDESAPVRAAVEGVLFEHASDEGYLPLLLARREAVVRGMADRTQLIEVAARLNLAEAVPALQAKAAQDAQFLTEHGSVLAAFRLPEAHGLLVDAAGHPDPRDPPEVAVRLALAVRMTAPMPDAAAVHQAIDGLDLPRKQKGMDQPWEAEVRNLGRWATVEGVLAELAEARDPYEALQLTLGAAERCDPRFRAVWLADLARDGERRGRAFLGLAQEGTHAAAESPGHAGTRAAAEALVTWAATEAGRGFLAERQEAAAPAQGEGVRSGFLEGHEWMVRWSGDYGTDPLGTLVDQAIWDLAGTLPPDLAVRLIGEFDLARRPMVALGWIGTFAGRPDRGTAAIPTMVRIAERILAPEWVAGEPACGALDFLLGSDPDAVRAALKAATDRQLVACARVVLQLGTPDLVNRLRQAAAGADARLSLHARAAFAWADRSVFRQESPVRLGAMENPFARLEEPAVAEAMRAQFGEDPFGAVRR